MDVVEQHSELTMGWCIDCHRQTEVQWLIMIIMKKCMLSLKKTHPDESFNVEAIGGLECGKCHH